MHNRAAILEGLLAILLALICGQPSRAQAAPANDTGTLLLQGGVQHSERLPPVPPQLRPGIPFSEALLPRLEPANDWFLLPGWLVGTWHQDEQTVISQRDYKTGAFHDKPQKIASRADFSEGYQKDALGGVWQYKKVPSVSKVDGGLFMEYHLVTDSDWLKDEDRQLVVRTRYTAVSVSMSDWRIQKVHQREDIQTNKPDGKNKVRADFSSKEFDENGEPSKLTLSWMTLKRTAGFSPIDQSDGKDLRQLFRSFLLSSGNENRLPSPASVPQ